MTRVKKSYFLIGILIISFLYVLFQISIIGNLKSYPSKYHQDLNPKFDHHDKVLKDLINKHEKSIEKKQVLVESISTASISSPKPRTNKLFRLNKQTIMNNLKSEALIRTKSTLIDIPTDYNDKKPILLYQLPFYHKYNYFNFSIITVEADTIKPILVNKTKTSKNQFINIELENRIVDVSMLKQYEFSTEKPVEAGKNLRGINLDKMHMYLPDSDGMFKCLNSNVCLLSF